MNPLRGKSIFTLSILFTLLLTLGAAHAEGPDDDYLAIYGIISQADSLATSGKTNQAHAKYIEAQRALAGFQRSNPNWNTQTVAYRMNYLAGKVAATAAGTVVAPEKSDSAVVKKGGAANANAPVKLLAAGSEPRTVLRLHPAAGDKQTMLMTMKMGMEVSAGGNQMPAMDIPAMLMTMEVVVKDLSATGDVTYEMVFTDATTASDPSVAPAMAAAMKSSLEGLKGMSGTGKMSSQGIISSLTMKLPAGADPQSSQTMDQMKDSFSGSAIALPNEAVGIGAKWEYKTKLKSQGMTIDQTADYELVAIEGDRLTLRSTVKQSSANQKIESPAMPGMKMDLIKMTGTATGSTTLDLGKVMPVAATVDGKNESSMAMNVGQQKQTMDTKMTLKVTFEAK